MKQKDYSRLTCSDIIAESKISRSTFYLYFKNKDQVVVHLCDDIFNHIFDKNLTKEKHHDFSKENVDELKHIITHSFYHFLEDFSSPEFMPLLQGVKELKCNGCGNTFEDIINTGKFGCENCYSTFEDRIDPILKRIHGSNRHIGRIGKITDQNIMNELKNNNDKKVKKEEVKKDKLEELKDNLKEAIKEERYEDAAKLRDEIKKMEK